MVPKTQRYNALQVKPATIDRAPPIFVSFETHQCCFQVILFKRSVKQPYRRAQKLRKLLSLEIFLNKNTAFRSAESLNGTKINAMFDKTNILSTYTIQI
jgi:hypothetical protein